jgi:hypothetical protein
MNHEEALVNMVASIVADYGSEGATLGQIEGKLPVQAISKAREELSLEAYSTNSSVLSLIIGKLIREFVITIKQTMSYQNTYVLVTQSQKIR